MSAMDDLFAPPPALIAGVDEAGRGPLAGPVAVAAVILDPSRTIDGLDDSKKLTEARREALAPLILKLAAVLLCVTHVLQRLGRNVKRGFLGPAQFALGGGHALFAQRRTMRLVAVLFG